MESPVRVIRLVTGAYRVNTYIISCPDTNKGVLLDPGGDAEEILQVVQDMGLTIEWILNTHGHADHIAANQDLKNKMHVPIGVHENDVLFFAKPDIREISEKELGLAIACKADRFLQDGDLIKVGNLEIKVIHTPGHTPGSSCFLVSGNLFTGDTLFVGDVGRTDLTGGSLQELLRSIKDKILPLPPETLIWPGHDYGETPSSTLAWELKENPYITDFILAED